MYVRWSNGRKEGTHVVNAAAQVEEHGLGEFASIHTIVLAQLLAAHRSGVDVEQHLLVLGTRLDDVAAVGDEVVKGGKHLCVWA